LNAGQRAILVALAYPEPNRSGKASPSKLEGVHQGALSQARCIVKWCPEYVEDILADLGCRLPHRWQALCRELATCVLIAAVPAMPQIRQPCGGEGALLERQVAGPVSVGRVLARDISRAGLSSPARADHSRQALTLRYGNRRGECAAPVATLFPPGTSARAATGNRRGAFDQHVIGAPGRVEAVRYAALRRDAPGVQKTGLERARRSVPMTML
jgi:hypothetical protein